MRTVSILLVMLFWLAACGQQKPSQPSLPKTPTDTSLFDMQRDELQRAKGVEKTLQQSQAQQQAIDQQSK